jgi:Amt family ammonium transporter
VGVIEGHWGQLGNQAVGILIAIVLSVVGTFVLLKLVDLVIGLRMSPEDEMEGMDVTQHGEEGYDWA